MTQASLEELFAQHGRVHDVRITKDLFSGECKGFAHLKMEDITLERQSPR
jgi:hypothetical protein